MNKFDEIQSLLGLTDKERAQILSINMANSPSRKYKEVWIGLGGTQSAVYATEVPPRNTIATPPRRRKSSNWHGSPGNWEAISNWPSGNWPAASGRNGIVLSIIKHQNHVRQFGIR